MTPTEQAIDEIFKQSFANYSDEASYHIEKDSEEAKAKLLALVKEAEAKTAKAYGGCTNCYGKGYATVNDQWVGVDTDQDIGSPGGVVRGGSPTAMKFCTCDRGELLKQLQSKEVQG